MIWTPKSHGWIYFVFVRFYFFSFDLQYIGIYFCYSFHLVCHWNIAIMFFFKFVIYCFLSLLLILEHQPLKLSGVYFRCRFIIVQPKAIFLYVLNVCFFLQWLFTILGYCVHILMTSSFSVESITRKCLVTRTALSPNAMYNTCFLLLINIYLVLHHISIFFLLFIRKWLRICLAFFCYMSSAFRIVRV